MSEIKRHLCESCGAVLDVDLEKQIYTCPFCGITYDYAYFKEDDILQKVEVFVERKEYKAALDALNFYLSKNPHDGNTLEKIMLLTYDITSIKKLCNKQIQDNFSCDPEETRWILDRAQDDSAERLGQIHDILVKMSRIYGLNEKIAKVDNDIEDAQKEIDRARIKIRENYCTAGSRYDGEYTQEVHPKKVMKNYVFVSIFVAIVGILAALGFYARGIRIVAWAFGILSVLYAAAIALGTYFSKIEPKLKEIAYYEKKETRSEVRLKELENDKDLLLNECNEIRQHIKRTVLELSSHDGSEDV